MVAVEELRRRRPDVPWLIPVRLDDCMIPELDIGAGRMLASIQCADLFGKQQSDQVRRLVEQVRNMMATLGGLTDGAGQALRPAAYLENSGGSLRQTLLA